MKRTLFTVLLLIILSIASISRNAVWDNDMTLWNDAFLKAPTKVRGLNEVGLYFVAKHEYSNAIRVFQQSLAVDRYQPTIYVNLGLAYEGINMPDSAIQAYSLAIQIDQGDPVPYYNLGVLYYRTLHDQERAFENLQKALRLNPSEPDVHLYLSYVYRDRGESQRAAEEYQQFTALK